MAEKRNSRTSDTDDIASLSERAELQPLVSSPDSSPFGEEVPESEIEESFDDRLKQWVEATNTESALPLVYLYKYENAQTGEEKEFVQKWVNLIPDYETIGLTHGSGRYLICCVIPRSKTNRIQKTRSYRIRIGKRFDELRAKADQEAKQAQYAAMGLPIGNPAAVGHVSTLQSPQDSLQHAFGMMEKMFSMFMPLLAQSLKPVQQIEKANPNDMMLLMAQNMRMMQEMTKGSVKDLASFGRELVNQQFLNASPSQPQLQEPEEMEPKEPPTLMEQILPIVSTLLPALMQGGIKGAATAATVQAIPQVQQVLQDKNEIKKFCDAFDKKFGKESVDKALKTLKIERPK